MKKSQLICHTKGLSLALILFLFGFGTAMGHNNPGYSHDATIGYSNPDWMSKLPDSIPLSALSIPGTHDTMADCSNVVITPGAFALSTAGSLALFPILGPISGVIALGPVIVNDICSTQTMPLATQLSSGIRALDIRAKHTDNHFEIVHTIELGFDFGPDVLAPVIAFLEANKNEVVVMRVSQSGDPSGNSRTFEDTFKDYRDRYGQEYFWTPSDQIRYTPEAPTLGDARGKIVILQHFSENIEQFGIIFKDIKNLQDDYELGTNWDLYDKWVKVRTHLQQADDPKGRDEFYINYLSGAVGSFPYFVASGHSSPQTGAARLSTGLVTGWAVGSDGHYREFPRTTCVDLLFSEYCTISFEGTNIMAMNYINAGQIKRRAGMVMADFPGRGLIDAVIKLNFPAWEIPSLKVTLVGDGEGKVTGLGINCGNDCKQEFAAAGTEITLMAAPAVGSDFKGWSNDGGVCGVALTCKIRTGNNMRVTASFDLIPQTLTVNKTGSGHGSVVSELAGVSGIGCDYRCLDASLVYDYGNEVILTAVPISDSEFTGWGGAAAFCGTNTRCTLSMKNSLTATAQFRLKPRLVVQLAGAGNGSVSSQSAGIDCGGDCTELYVQGTKVTLTALARKGSAFAGWEGDADCSDGIITMNDDAVCGATFIKTEFTLTVGNIARLGLGSISSNDNDIDCGLDCTETYTVADFPTPKTVKLTATAESGSIFGNWSGDYDCAPTEEEKNTSNGRIISVTVNDDLHCTASFVGENEEFTLTVQKRGGGFGHLSVTAAGYPSDGMDCDEPICSQTYMAGTEVMLTATPLRGSKISGFTGAAGCENLTGQNGAMRMVRDLVCAATFELPVLLVDDDQANDSNCKFGEQSSDAVCQAYLGTLGLLNQVDRPNPIEDPPDPSLDNVPEFTVGSDDIWNTGDKGYPTKADLANYSWVIWFTGSEHNFTAGPNSAGEEALSQWLDEQGGCLVISSQQYYADRNNSEPTSFMKEYLGVGSVIDNGGQPYPNVAGAGSTFSGLGPYTLHYSDQVPVANFSDLLAPTAGAEKAFFYDQAGVAAIHRDNGTYRTLYFGFPLEVLGANDRREVMREVIDFCHDTPLTTLTVSAPTGSGSGSIASTAADDCSTGCSATVASGTTVTLTATAETGSVLLGWTGAGVTCGTESTCNVQVDADQITTAQFAATKNLTVVRTGPGIVTSAPSGINCGTNCSELYVLGETVTLSALPEPGSEFVGWSDAGAICSTSLTCVIAVDADQSVTARFKRTGTLAVTATGPGAVMSSPGGINCGTDCTEQYAQDTTVLLKAIPDPGAELLGWSGAGVVCGSELTCEVKIGVEQFVTAEFGAGRTLQVISSGVGFVVSNPSGIACGPEGPDCTQVFSRDLPVALVAIPGKGYEFVAWSNDGCGSQQEGNAASPEAQVTMSIDQTCTATFAQTESDGGISVPSIFSSILPSSRSVQVGNTVTAFATVINAGSVTATDCGIAPPTSVPADFSYQTTNATNALIGTANTPVDIAAGGNQSYVFAFTPTASFSAVDAQLTFDCTNSDPAAVTVGLNTLLLVADSGPVPDIVALGTTLTGDGIVNLSNTGVFAVAAVNVGIAGTITVSADTGSASLPVSIALCETNPATGVCINPTVPTLGPVTTSIAANATPTFAFFVTATNTVPFDPANNRIFVRFQDAGGVTRGSTSVAVRTL